MVLKKFGLLALNYLYDIFCFIKHSGVFFNNTQDKIEGKIAYYYHSIEKGLINKPIRYQFGKVKVKKLSKFLKIWLKRNYELENTQFIAGCCVLVKYHQLHREKEMDISDIISREEIALFSPFAIENNGGTISFKADEYFRFAESPFESFSNSRKSVRHFSGKWVPVELIEQAVKIAGNAPSVCNRQSIRVKMINSKELTRDILKIQAGLNATADTVKQLLIVTGNLNVFVSEVERNQMFVDGGIFLQNLLYALHYKKVAACGLNWSKPFFFDYRIRKVLNISHSEKIIAIVAIGYPLKTFKTPFSRRKRVSEILEIYS